MSDTPRSNDAGKVVIPSGGGVRMVNPELGEKPWVVPFTFAQELERENAELRDARRVAEQVCAEAFAKVFAEYAAKTLTKDTHP